MAQAGYHHANHLAQEIREELQGNQQQMIALLQNYDNVTHERDTETDGEHNLTVANAATSINVQSETLKVLQDLQKQLQTISQEVKNGGGNNGRKREFKKTPDDPPYTRANTEKYCWTHGACNHESKECTRRAPGHEAKATKPNKLGGSKAFCE